MADNANSGHAARSFRRERLNIVASVSVNGGPLVPVSVVDISGNGIGIIGPPSLTVGTRVIVHMERIGAVHGHVSRLTDERVAIAFSDTPDGHDLRQRRIDWRASLKHDRRRHGRARPIAPRGRRIVVPLVSMASGAGLAEVMDISESGMSVRSDIPLRSGDRILVGGVPGEVLRVAFGMTALRYDDAQQAGRIILSSEAASSPQPAGFRIA